MVLICLRSRGFTCFIISGLFNFLILITPFPAFAQGVVLEEVIVTAQRREQSLQEVPVSLEVFSGLEVRSQGFRNFEDMSKFSPSVTVRDGSSQQSTTIRGFGTEGNSLTLQAAAPIFLDGIHFGRPSMIKTAFLDVGHVEILKGPQPLHFGMDAVAGAFNIQSARPTPEWEGEISSEVGNFGNLELEGAFGGPLTETLGIRVAGILEHDDGPVKNRITREKYLKYNSLGGRIMLEWTPGDKFNLMGKFEISDQKNGGELRMGCLTEGTLLGFGSLDGAPAGATAIGEEKATQGPPPQGVGMDGVVLYEKKNPKDCFKGEYGNSWDGPYLEVPLGIVSGYPGSIKPGYYDIRDASEIYSSRKYPGGVRVGDDGVELDGTDGKDNTFTWNAMIAGNYVFDNGFTLTSETGWVFFDRINIRENCDCFFFQNHFGRSENFYQLSQHFRIETPETGIDLNMNIPGGLNVNAMAGVFWQNGDLDVFTQSLRADVRQGNRHIDIWEDSRWYAGFWNLDFNLFDGQVTASIGGRYADVRKDTQAVVHSRQWIYDVFPCNSAGTDSNPATCARDPDFKQVDPNLTSYTTFDAINGVDSSAPNRAVRVDSPLILLDEASVDMSNLWTARSWLGTRDMPLSWYGPEVNAVGLTAPVYATHASWGECDVCIAPLELEATNYDTQFVLSFTPDMLDGGHTFYTKYATAFKGPVTDTGLATIGGAIEEVTFLPEYVTAYEVGARGFLFNRRFRYDITAFRNRFKDLQTVAAARFFAAAEDQRIISLNAGEQVVKGLEFGGQYAATQNLTLSLAGAIMHGRMNDFDGGGCTTNEFVAAAADAVNNPSGRSADELAFANEIMTNIGPENAARALSMNIPDEYLLNGGCRLEDKVLEDGTVALSETFNHTGDTAYRTPDYKIVMGLDYMRPILGNEYLFYFNAKGFISDDMLAGSGSSLFNRETVYTKNWDVNLSGGIGSGDGTWRLMGYARNIKEVTLEYRPEYDMLPGGFIGAEVPDSAFFQYGLRLEYQFR